MPKGVYARNRNLGEMTAEHIEDIKIEQKPDVVGSLKDRKPEVVEVDHELTNNDFNELAFNEEPVKIVLESGTADNAPTTFPVWVNGKGGEILINGKWCEVTYFPIGSAFTTKRKYLAVIVGAKIDKINTVDATAEDIIAGRDTERVRRRTSSVIGYSVLEDRNPLGPAWLAELRRRNM